MHTNKEHTNEDQIDIIEIYNEFELSDNTEYPSKVVGFINDDRNKLLQSRSDLTTQSFKDTVYSMLHSFSHMLMHELAYYSGFSVNELAEKIYFMDSPISTRGLLIYTRSGDSQCSMGGLSDLVSAEILEKIIKSDSKLQLYSVNNITDGTDSLGEVTVRIEKNGIIVNGIGSDTDIVIASAKAYLNAINKLSQKTDSVHPQLDHV